jgi:hypothetical protein
MKTTFLFIAGLMLSTATWAQYNNDNLSVAYNHFSVSSFTFENLRIYPVHANEVFLNANEGLGEYTNLKDAIEKREIKVSEVSENGTVNTLFAENASQDSIYVMAGEIVKGGKQDRVIAQDFVIAPGEKVNVGAFCVEQGRWHTKSTGTNFEGYFNVSSKAVRKAALVDKNQQEVWKEVAVTTGENEAESSTGAYTALEQSADYQKQLQAYLKKFSSAFDNVPTVIGVVAVTGDQVIGCDLFANHHLFQDAYNNLLHSYVTEAVTKGKKVTVSEKKVQAYMDAFLADESKQEEELKKDGSMFKHGGKTLRMSKF